MEIRCTCGPLMSLTTTLLLECYFSSCKGESSFLGVLEEGSEIPLNTHSTPLQFWLNNKTANSLFVQCVRVKLLSCVLPYFKNEHVLAFAASSHPDIDPAPHQPFLHPAPPKQSTQCSSLFPPSSKREATSRTFLPTPVVYD